MDFDPTDEQRMLAETVNSLLDKRYDPASRLKLLDSELGWSRELWQQYAQLGLLGLTFDEQYDGAGMGGAELATVMESFGRSLVLEPFFATVVLGGTLVSQAGTPEQKSAILPKVAAGELLLAFAYTEPGTRWSQTDIATTAVRSRDGDGWTISGEKIAVLGADSADTLIVSAVTPDGIGLFLVDAADVSVDALRHAGRPARRGRAPRRRARAAPRHLGRRHRSHLDRDRRRDRGAVRRGDRRLRADAVDDRRLPEDPGAVRPADRGVPGAAVPRGGHVRRARAGPLDGAAGPALA